jgi:hypothetical protein
MPPVTTPVEVPIPATDEELVLHVPPLVISVSVVDVPVQTPDEPEIAAGFGLTVTG